MSDSQNPPPTEVGYPLWVKLALRAFGVLALLVYAGAFYFGEWVDYPTFLVFGLYLLGGPLLKAIENRVRSSGRDASLSLLWGATLLSWCVLWGGLIVWGAVGSADLFDLMIHFFFAAVGAADLARRLKGSVSPEQGQ